jgi:hypothetical protein
MNHCPGATWSKFPARAISKMSFQRRSDLRSCDREHFFGNIRSGHGSHGHKQVYGFQRISSVSLEAYQKNR